MKIYCLLEVTAEPRTLALSKQRVSSKIQRGNEVAVMSTAPAQRTFDDVFLTA